MATSFIAVYDKSISAIDDPLITQSYEQNPVGYFQIMYNYLQNARPRFNNPLSMISILNDIVEPSGQAESFIGDGSNNIFVLSSTPTSDAFFKYTVNNIIITGSFSSITNSVTLTTAPALNASVVLEWYTVGYFNQNLDYTALNILSKLLVICWAEKEKNFLLDIRRLLNDTDFKLHDASASSKSKVNWYEDMREETEKLMNQYAWTSFTLSRR